MHGMVGELVNGRYKLYDFLLGSLGSGRGDKQCDTQRERGGTDKTAGIRAKMNLEDGL